MRGDIVICQPDEGLMVDGSAGLFVRPENLRLLIERLERLADQVAERPRRASVKPKDETPAAQLDLEAAISKIGGGR